MSKKQILIPLISAVLLVAIPVTIYLVRQSQTIKSGAEFTNNVQFLDRSGSVITSTGNTNIKLRIIHQNVSSI